MKVKELKKMLSVIAPKSKVRVEIIKEALIIKTYLDFNEFRMSNEFDEEELLNDMGVFVFPELSDIDIWLK